MIAHIREDLQIDTANLVKTAISVTVTLILIKLTHSNLEISGSNKILIQQTSLIYHEISSMKRQLGRMESFRLT